MKKTLFRLLFLAASLSAHAQVSYQVVPLPRSIQQAASGTFTLTQATPIVCTDANEKMVRNERFLAEYLQQDLGLELTIDNTLEPKEIKTQQQPKKRSRRSRSSAVPEETATGAIVLQLGLQNENPDSYEIKVNQRGITITGATESGVYRGVQTLRKSLGVESEEKYRLPYVTIKDEPRFQYRGAMLDCARHYFPVEYIKQYIDILALHGVNQFHWHITDDQGWRFEVKALPELAQKGSRREQTVIGHNCGIYDGTPYGEGAYYTQQQCRELVRYAAERYINIIPEIDLPGHMVAALHVYPQLGCTGGPYNVMQLWGVADDVLCAGNPETLKFLKTVLGELTDVFPSPYIHIGGDESPRVRWKACPKCQAKKQVLGLADESQLQTYINKELEAFMRERGRDIIGWDETLEGGLSEHAIVMSWRGYEGGIAAARQHHRVIMTPTSNCYIDYYQLKNTSWQPLAIGGYLPMSKVYEMEPVPAELTQEEAQYIMGPQCNLWTEYVLAPEHANYMLLPRLDAMSEVQWVLPAQKNLEDFTNKRLPGMLRLYNKLGIKYCPYHE